jgi:hypothetical protein
MKRVRNCVELLYGGLEGALKKLKREKFKS